MILVRGRKSVPGPKLIKYDTSELVHSIQTQEIFGSGLVWLPFESSRSYLLSSSKASKKPILQNNGSSNSFGVPNLKWDNLKE